MCNCIEEMNKQYAVRTGDPEATVILDTEIQITENLDLVERFVGYVFYRKKKKNGEFQQGRKKHPVAFSHCPFCGVKYE